MKRFITTRFFRALTDASQAGDAQVLNSEYEQFAAFLLSETGTEQDRAALRMALCYTLTELSAWKKFSGGEKK